MRRAIFVVGAESSGTRMLTEAFMGLGFSGGASHDQPQDSLNFVDAPDRIVFRRSLPHGHAWPPLVRLYTTMVEAGYEVASVLIARDKDVTAQSQLRGGHVLSLEVARAQIEYATEYAFREFAIVGVVPTVVLYEPFVRHRDVRRVFFASLGLGHPRMTFRDENRKYESTAASVLQSTGQAHR